MANVVERIVNPSTKQFRKEYLTRHRPVVLSNAWEGSPMLQEWTPTGLATRFPDRTVVLGSGARRFKSNLRTFVDYLTGQGSPGLPPGLYMHSILLSAVFPELMEEFTIPSLFQPNWLAEWPLNAMLNDTFCKKGNSSVVLFVGSTGASVGMWHRDRLKTHAWIAQVYGNKRAWLAAPDQARFLYQKNDRHNETAITSMNPDPDQFPLFAEADIAAVDLGPGDSLFVPSGWWHYAECLDQSISISGNFANRSNFASFKADLTEDPQGLKRGWPKPVLLTLQQTLCECRHLTRG